jgi:tRNA-2-methylthio-N6-dimethylallyladenosine synthase
MEKKRLYIRTFGCQMNVHDSEQLAALLAREGYEITGRPEEADLIVVNTCSIREKADQKVFSELGRFRGLKSQKPGLRIAVGGCLAQQRGRELLAVAPHVDLVFGTHQLANVPRLLSYRESGGGPVLETAFCDRVDSLAIFAPPPPGAVSAYVTIMQGCDNFCAYCVVPHLRGREQSRPGQEILNEIRSLADLGIREVTLLGQNVNSYGAGTPEGPDFPGLIREIGTVAGIERIRFTTSHPKDLSEDLIQCFREVESLCEHIHLPVQAGSNRVLARMNRGYTREAYLDKVQRLRDACPDISITSDIIVGFPGETEADFRETLDLMGKIRFDNLFSFKYSRREGTAALTMTEPVAEEVKSERLKILQALQDEHTQARNRLSIGRVEEILVEGVSRTSSRHLTGRTRGNKIVNFAGEERLIGRTVRCRIAQAFLHSLRGELQLPEV